MSSRKRSLSVPVLYIAVFMLISFLTLTSVNAFEIAATDVPFLGDEGNPIHENITRDALYFLNTAAQNVIIEANRRVDQDYIDTTSASSPFGNCPGPNCRSFDWEHFDNCQFSASIEHINFMYTSGLDSEDLDLANVGHNFGRLLHTVQDFYAHSNWVELGQSNIFDSEKGLWRSVSPFMIIDNVMIIEGSEADFSSLPFSGKLEDKRVIINTLDGELLGLISGTAYSSEGCPESLEVTHWDGVNGLIPPNGIGNNGLNKDGPSRAGFNEARTLAVQQTTHEWCRLVNLVGEEYGDEGVISLFKEWVDPDQYSEAIAACSDLNIDVMSKVPELLNLEIIQATDVGNTLDLIFVIDTTGSMEDDIAEVKQRASEIINQVAASGSDWRIGIVTYRDHPQAPYGDPGDYLFRVERTFSSNQNDIIAAINGIIVGGGGDGPEAVFAGLLEAIKQPWRNGARKVVILMGDAPPHDPDPVLGYTSQTVLQAAYDVDPASIFPILVESENAVRFPFQVLADGSSGQLFYASNANEVVPTLLTTINAATSTKLSIGLEAQMVSLDPDFPIRSAPSMRAGFITRIPRSERVQIIDGPKVVFEMSSSNVPENFIWWKVRSQNGSEGWVQELYYGEPILVPFSPQTSIPAVTCTLATLRDVNIRSGPGVQYQQIASRAGADHLLAATGQFGNINVPDAHWWQLIDGFWIRNDQVRESGDCANLPVVAAP